MFLLLPALAPWYHLPSFLSVKKSAWSTCISPTPGIFNCQAVKKALLSQPLEKLTLSLWPISLSSISMVTAMTIQWILLASMFALLLTKVSTSQYSRVGKVILLKQQWISPCCLSRIYFYSMTSRVLFFTLLKAKESQSPPLKWETFSTKEAKLSLSFKEL